MFLAVRCDCPDDASYGPELQGWGELSSCGTTHSEGDTFVEADCLVIPLPCNFVRCNIGSKPSVVSVCPAQQ